MRLRWRSQPSETLWAGYAVLAIGYLWREPAVGLSWLILSGVWAARAGSDPPRDAG
jgi:hypothetical protein